MSCLEKVSLHGTKTFRGYCPDAASHALRGCLGCVGFYFGQNLAVFWRPEEHTAEDVAQYFSRLPDLDWSQPVLIPALPITLVSSVSSVLLVFLHLV